MASNDDNSSEKPNLRPTKRIGAGGKSIFLHHNPKNPSNKSYIHAKWENVDEKSPIEHDPFGIEQPNIEYSLNKRQRWELLHDFRKKIPYEASSSSDDDAGVRSDCERHSKSRVQKKTHRRKFPHTAKTKYQLYDLHNIESNAKCVSIVSNTGPQRKQEPRKTYMQEQSFAEKPRASPNVSYYAVVPPPKDKQLANIRKKHDSKGIAKKAVTNVQRSKFTQVKERMDIVDQWEKEKEESSDDENDYDDEEEVMISVSSYLLCLKEKDFLFLELYDAKI